MRSRRSTVRRIRCASRPPRRAFEWSVFLGAAAVVVYFCILILTPFLEVIAWSAVLAIAWTAQRLLARALARRPQTDPGPAALPVLQPEPTSSR